MLSVKDFYFDDDDDLWANIHCNGRRQWRTVVGCDKEHQLYKDVLDVVDNHGLCCSMIEEYCREHGIEEQMAKLPHIEDASKPMQLAWEGADEWEYTSLGYYVDTQQFQKDYDMSVWDFKRLLQIDIDKYGIGTEIIETLEDTEYLYSVTWWLCEYFTGPVEGIEMR